MENPPPFLVLFREHMLKKLSFGGGIFLSKEKRGLKSEKVMFRNLKKMIMEKTFKLLIYENSTQTNQQSNNSSKEDNREKREENQRPRQKELKN